mmetsp:Transcript_6577/g.26754  ORF Transcript_6577/g.26754 Transcript_6577/m.26754 type:complete len:322 (+) Transcript_6577:655-1620(+)
MYLQSASLLYLCARVRPCSVAAAAPHALASLSTSCATYLDGSSSYPMRTLIVSGVRCMDPDIACTNFFILARPTSSLSSVEPAPLAHTPSMGHPMLTSTKSQSTSLSRNSPQRAMRSGWPPQTCTPKRRSLGCRLRSASSDRTPFKIFEAIAISDIVTSAPRATHTRLKGRLPTVVSGATYSLPRRSNFFDPPLASLAPSSPSVPPLPPDLGTGTLGFTSSHARRAACEFSTCRYDKHLTGTSMRRRTASDLRIGYSFLANSRWSESGNAFNSAAGGFSRYEPSFGCAPVGDVPAPVTSDSRDHASGVPRASASPLAAAYE